MLKLLASLAALCLVGTAAVAPGPGAPEAAAHEWTWIQVSPGVDTWNLRGGKADVVIDGEHFQATLYDAQGEVLHLLEGRADGERYTGVDFSSATGVSQRGLGPPYAGLRREAYPQTMGDAADPPQRMWESIALTSWDTFVGLTHR